jgi:tellurite resistance protein TerC
VKPAEPIDKRIDRLCVKLLTKLHVPNAPAVKRVFVTVVGSILLLAGIAMILLPGPAFIVIPLGLAVLASEFEWARRWLRRCQNLFHRLRKRRKARNA